MNNDQGTGRAAGNLRVAPASVWVVFITILFGTVDVTYLSKQEFLTTLRERELIENIDIESGGHLCRCLIFVKSSLFSASVRH